MNASNELELEANRWHRSLYWQQQLDSGDGVIGNREGGYALQFKQTLMLAAIGSWSQVEAVNQWLVKHF